MGTTWKLKCVLQALIRDAEQSLRTVLHPGSHFDFLQKTAGIPHQAKQKPRRLSHSGHTKEKKKNKPVHECQNPLKTLAATGKPGSNLRSTAHREIMVLKEAKRKNYWQKQSSYYIKMKERLSGSAATCSSAKASLKRQRRWQEPIQHVDQAAPIRSLGLSNKKQQTNKPIYKFQQLEGKFLSAVENIGSNDLLLLLLLH